jgi:DNA-3-methyladenine glycosylase II
MARSRTATRWSHAENHLRSLDVRWRVRLERVGPCQLRPMKDHFGTLIRSIVSQQISTQAAKTIESRLRLLTGGLHEPDRILALEELTLRGAGLSRAKASYVRNLAEAVASGRLVLKRTSRMTDADLIEHLTAVKGIGRWTAEMFLIFSLNRPDVLPVGDLGVRAGIRDHFELEAVPPPSECHRLTETWRPYRSIASWYLWRDKDRRQPNGDTSSAG